MQIAKELKNIRLEEELRQSYLDYAMSVIVGRALPDVRDGLKPVQRRILYVMYQIGNLPDRPFKKSARVVGEVMGKYHPHGDAPIYEALVRMAQPFNMRYPLVEGQGNFGSMDGDSPAAMRYTEVRLAKIAMEMLKDLDKDTVPMRPNFDDTLKEPEVLPALLPNLLVNGSSGIAVGMSTSIPPHNLSEVVDALVLLIDRPEATLSEVMELLPAPDFPTGGVIDDPERLEDIYRSGRGTFHIRGKWTVEQGRNGRKMLVITEIPYQINKASLVERIASMIASGKLPGADEVRDESNRQGVRIVIELKRGAPVDVVVSQLLRHTDLRTTFNVILVALIDGQPRRLSLLEILREFLRFRREVVTKRAQHDLKIAEDRRHIVVGLLSALDIIDEIISTIRASESAESAKTALMEKFGFTEKQAQAILAMRLQRLAKLERFKLEEEKKKLDETIAYNRRILTEPAFLDEVVKQELVTLKERFGDKRRTELLFVKKRKQAEGIPQRVELVDGGYIRRSAPDKDIATDVWYAVSTRLDAEVLLVTNHGRAFRIEVAHLPEKSKGRKGLRISDLMPMSASEYPMAVFPLDWDIAMVVITAGGRAKVVPSANLMDVRSRSFTITGLNPGDEVAYIAPVSEKNLDKALVMVVTRGGKGVLYRLADFSRQGVSGKGSRLVRVAEGDAVVDADILLDAGKKLYFTMTEDGYGKATPLDTIPVRGRGSSGVKVQNVDDIGGVVLVKLLADQFEKMRIITDERTWILPRDGEEHPVMGRNARGKKIMRGSVKVIGKVEEWNNL